jgi:glycerol-3-phosphate O-acyltransferase
MIAARPVEEAENRLARFNRDRDRIVDTVARRVFDDRLTRAERGGDASLEYVLNEVAYAEMSRLSGRRDRKSQRRYQEWRELAGKLGTMHDGDKRDHLVRLATHYARDIAGNFNPAVYRFASGVIPRALGLAFAPIDSDQGFSGMARLADRVQVQGPLDAIRACCERGTLVVAPTHSSNMDSIVIGFAMQQAGLPPMTYGAGKNLFSNRLISFFMHNLGAYRVDRRLRFSLYKDVLKEYSTVLLEYGYHSLFFPGGTRCRSNLVERHLKLGLLGTGLQAFENNARGGHAARRIYVVPVTINYHLVLEAETLIDDHLADEGKARYIITDDEFSRLGRVVEFLRRTLALEESVVIRLGPPMDVFGNPCDPAGDSLDPRGRRVEPASYLLDGAGRVASDRQRNAEYTRLLGEKLCAAYQRETVFLTTHLAARALYDAMVMRARTDDVYRLLRIPPAEIQVPLPEVAARIDSLSRTLAVRPEWGTIHDRVRAMSAVEIADDALRALGIYHTQAVAQRVGDAIRIECPRLLLYYRNRTAHVEQARA